MPPQGTAAPHSTEIREPRPLGFCGQLDGLVTVLTTLLVFTTCVLSGTLSIKASLLIAAGIFLVGSFVERRVGKSPRIFRISPRQVLIYDVTLEGVLGTTYSGTNSSGIQ